MVLVFREQETVTKISPSVCIVARAQREKVRRRNDWERGGVRGGWENILATQCT